jgi:hypothetical protein
MLKAITLTYEGSPNAYIARYKAHVQVTGFDKKRHRMIVQINNQNFETDYDAKTKKATIKQPYQLKDSNGFLPSKEVMTVKAYLYDFIADKVLYGIRTGFTVGPWDYTPVIAEEPVSTVPVISGYWDKEKKVTKVTGPFDEDGNLVTEIKAGEWYTYKGKPNKPLLTTDLLSMKWAYRYDDGEITSFKHHKESVEKGVNVMRCSFPEGIQAKELTVYAYFVEPVDRVSKKNTLYKQPVNSEKPSQSADDGGTQPVENDGQVSSADKQTNPTGCICKEADLIWGKKVSCAFRLKVIQICKDLWGEARKIEMANGLMAVMYVETSGTFSASKIELRSFAVPGSKTKKKRYTPLTKDEIMALGENFSGAVGLIQFTPAAITALNNEFSLKLTKRKLALMTEITQLDYVKLYFEMGNAYKKMKGPEDIYLQVFAPIGVGKNKDFVLYSKDKDKENGTEYYKANKSVDEENNKDGKIQRSEILGRYYKSYESGEGARSIIDDCSGAASKSKKVEKEPETPNGFNANDIVTYNIYHTGEIEKHIPAKIKAGAEKKYRYVYHDKEGALHELGIYQIKKTKKVNDKKGGYVNLISLSTVKKTYSKGDCRYTFNIDSPRKYMNEKTLASFFGAMLEVGFDDISCNGFSHEDGSSKPSVSHINGNNGDFKYLRKDKKLMFGDGTSLHINTNPDMLDAKRQNQWNDALYKFGWKSMLGWSYKRDGKTMYLNHVPKNTKDHHHHLHVQGYSPNFEVINE